MRPQLESEVLRFGMFRQTNMALSSLMVLCFVFVNGNFEKFGTGRNGKEIRQ